MDTLLNFSGGFDSTYCLYKYLVDNPNKTLLVHHCNWKTYFNRHDQESLAVKNILEWLKNNNLGNFKYIETTVDIRELGVKPVDHQIVAFMTGILLLNPTYKSIKYSILPTPKDELDRLGKQLDVLWNDAAKIRAMPRLTVVPPKPHQLIIKQPMKNLYKVDAMAEIPGELKEMFFSCRTPINGNPCDKCHTCKQLNRLS